MSEGDLNLEQFDYWPAIYPLDHCDSVRNSYLFLKLNSGQDNRQDFQCTFDKKIKRQNNAEPISFLFWTALTGQREENGFQFTGWNCGLPGHEKRIDRNKCWQENIACKRGQNHYLLAWLAWSSSFSWWAGSMFLSQSDLFDGRAVHRGNYKRWR